MLLDDNFEMQGGVRNYLGKTEEVKAPKYWKSSKDSPSTELVYITDEEKKLLLEANLHDSLKNGKPNKGASGLSSFDGWGDKNSDGSSDTSGGNAGAEGGQGSGNSNDSYSGGGGSYTTPTPDLPPGVRDNNASYGDPDPQVDVDPRDRDSITSFKDNYIANVKSNPLYAVGIGGLLHTAYQTGQAKSMLSGVPGYEFLDYSDGNTPTVQPIAGGGDSGNTTALLAASPYLVSGTTQVESEASKWYNSIGNNTKQFNFASAYAIAKEKVSQTLNNKGPIGMLAVSDSPYYDWLKTNKLDRGIL